MRTLRKIRNQIKKSGKKLPPILDEEIKELYSKMNEEKVKALREIEIPFLEKLKELEEIHGIELIMRAE